MSDILRIENMEGVYDKTITAVRNVDITVEEGSITGLVGPNGAGKTDLLKFVSGLARRDRGEVTRGSIRFRGEHIENLDPNTIAKMGIVMTMEERPVFEHLTVEENLRATPADDPERVTRFFPELERIWDSTAGYISGGEQQMLVMAMALLCDPEVLVHDEPFMGLAPSIVNNLETKIREINEDLGVTIVLAGEDAQNVIPMTDYTYIMQDGQVVLEGPPEDLLSDDRIKKYYLGDKEQTYADVKYYRRRKRWHSKKA
jgi:branched-chain amino acid transport system ATP-binding protein